MICSYGQKTDPSVRIIVYKNRKILYCINSKTGRGSSAAIQCRWGFFEIKKFDDPISKEGCGRKLIGTFKLGPEV